MKKEFSILKLNLVLSLTKLNAPSGQLNKFAHSLFSFFESYLFDDYS